MVSFVGCRIQIRYILAVLSFLGVVLSTAAKTFMGAAIVAMVKNENNSSRNVSISTDGTCPSSGIERDIQVSNFLLTNFILLSMLSANNKIAIGMSVTKTQNITMCNINFILIIVEACC